MIERINCSDTAMMTKPSEHGAMATLRVAAARMRGMSTSAAPASAWSAFDVVVNIVFLLGLASSRIPPYRRTIQIWSNGSGGNLRLIYGGYLRFASAISGADRQRETKANGRGAQTPRR